MATFTWTNPNSGDWTDPANWDLGSIPGSGDAAVLPSAAGTAAVASGGSVTLDSLVSQGGTLALGDAAVLTVTTALTLGGVIQGGTIQDSGAATLFQGGTLSGVTYQGPLSLTGTGQSLFVENGLILDGAAGVGTPGSIDLTAAVTSGISMLDSETLDDATLSFGVDDYLDTGAGLDDGQTLTLGGGFTVDVNAGDGALGFQNTDITVDDIGDTLSNDGLITVANDGTLDVDYGTIVSVGTIQDDGDSALIVNGQSGFLASFDNQGSIGVSDGAYFLVGATTASNEGTITLTTGGVLEVANQLTNAGSVSVNDGGELLLDSGLVNAVTGQIIVTAGGGLIMDGGAVTNSGTIEADGDGTFLDYGTLFDNQGSIAITGGSYTDLGAATTSNEGTIIVTTGGDVDVESQLANAGGVSVDNGHLFLDGGLTNAVTGQITVTDAGGLWIYGDVFDNQGSIATDSNVYIGANAASNEGTIAVTTGGALQVTNLLVNAGGVSVDAGQLYLDNGLTNAVTGQITVTDAGALYLDGEAIDNQGSIAVADSQAYISVNAASNEGTITLTDASTLYLDAGTIDNQGSIAFATGSNAFIGADTLSNEGTIAVSAGSTVQVTGLLTNAGLIAVDAGELDLDSGFTDAGAGQIDLTDGATLVVDGNVTAADFASITGAGGTVEIYGTLEGASVTGNAFVHVGDTASFALIVANTAQTGSPGFTAAATGAFDGDVTGATGGTGDIAPGGTDTSSVNVTFPAAATAAVGYESGDATVALTFDGSATSVIIDVPVSVTVDNYATAAIQLLGGPGVLTQTGDTYTLDMGSVPAGGIENLDSLDLANLAPAGQPADWLTGTLDASGDAAFTNDGLGAFGTLNAGQVTPFSVDLSTFNTGTFSETITLAGIDGNSSGFALAQDATLVVTGTAAPVAVAQINTPTPIVLPDTHAATGGTPDDTIPLSIINAGTTDAAGLFAAVTTLTGGAYGSGRISDLSPGDTDDSSIVVGVNNLLAGALSGDVTIAFGSGGSGAPGDDLVQNGDFSDGLTGWTDGNSVDGAGAFGIPGFESNPNFLTFGSVGGDADTSQTLATVPGVEYQIQFWYYSSGSHPNDLNVWFGDTDVVSLTNPPNTGWTEYTADATAVSASTVLTIGARNDPSWDALDDISVSAVDGGSYPLPPQTFSVSGNVYRLAAPVVNGDIYVHQGDPGSTVLTVTNNIPADGYSEGLEAAIVGPATGGLTGASGATGDIAAGGTDASSLVIGFSTATIGVTTGTVPIAQTSDGTGVDSLGLTSLGTVDVPVTVSVDNYATASIQQNYGNGALTQDGNVYTLNLGTFGLGGGSYTSLEVANSASGPADWLTGSLSAVGDPVFFNQNVGAVGTIDAGDSDDFQVGMSILAFGTYTETITLTATDGNPSGFAEALPTETLVVIGTVVPQLESGYVFQNTGSTLYVGPGTSFETFTLQGGTIEGGTVVDTGSGMVFEGGALSDVTYDGTLDLTPAYSSLAVINGFTATGEDGTGPGTINLGYDSSVYFEDNQTLDNATITVDANYASVYQYTTSNYYFNNSEATGTLTIGPNLTIDQLGAYGSLGSNGWGGGTIVNQGSFNAAAGYGYYSINPTVFDNAGQITVDSGEALYIDPATFTNEADGTVTVESGAALYLGGNGGSWTNDGSIVIEAGASLFLQGTIPIAQLGSVTNDSGVVYINGTLVNTGNTLDVGSGTALTQLVLSNGEILGGVIQDFGQGLQADNNYWNILNGVTYEGTLDLSTRSNGYLHLQNGTTLTGAGGMGPGMALITGYYDHLIVDGSQTLDNGTIDIGNASNGWWDYLESYDGNGPATLTLGANLLIRQTGYYAQIDTTNGYAGSQIVNLGTINAGVAGLAGTRFYVYGPDFDNQASISVANGVYFYNGSGTFSNEGSITITGGSELEVQNPLGNTGSIAVEDGTLRLDAGYNDLGTISVGPSGIVLLPNNATVAEIEALEANNDGTIAINGAFDDTGQTLTVTNGIVAFQNTMSNNGTVVVNGTTLLLDNGLNGTGEIELSPTGVLASGANLLQIDGANLGGTLAGMLANDGGSLALVGGFTIAAGITDTVTFEGAQFGWFSNGYATLAGPGTLASSGTVNVTDWGGGEVQLLLTGGMTWDNFGTVYDRDVVQLGTAAGDSATIVNEAGALFDLADGDGRVTGAGTGNYSFVNLGTLGKDNGGNSYVTVPVINSGVITSTNGLLELRGGTLGGTIYGGGGSVGMVGTYNSSLGTTNTVTFGGGQADFGWFSDGFATLSGPGTLASLGQANVSDWGGGEVQLLLTGGITWDNSGSIYARDVVQFGTAAGDSATIVNEAGALFDLASNDGQITTSGAGSYDFDNQGTLEKDNGGTSRVYASVINSGLITSTNGLLELRGGTLGGTIYSVSGSVGMVGTYTSSAGTTDTVTFGGGQADFGWLGDGYATLSGPGTLASSGQVNVTDWGGGEVQLLLTGGITWDNSGSVYARDVVQFGTAAGDSATIVNEAGALFDLASSDGRITVDGAGTYNFVNLGTLQKDNGGNSYVYASVINSGLITSTNGLLELRGGTLGGTIYSVTGSVGMVGTYTSSAGTTDTVTFGGGQADFGWFNDGYATLSGPGTLASSGQVNVTDWGGGEVQLLLTGGITWDNSGSVYARDIVQFGTAAGDSATMVNESGALFDLASSDARLTTDGAGDYNFVNDGTILQNGGGNNYFETPLTNAGLVETTNGFLEIGNATLGGTFEAAGGNLGLVGTYAAASGITDTVDFVGATLGWFGDGAANLTGPGTVVSTGDVFVQDDGGGTTQLIAGGGVTWNNAGTVYDYGLTVLTGGAVWENTGTVYDRYRLRFGAADGDSATFVNAAGALFDMNSGSSGSYVPYTGTYAFTNAGTVLQNGGGADYFTAPLTNTGLVETTSGQLEISNATLGGTFEANGGSLLLVGTYTAAANTTDTVDFQSAVLGWYGDGIAVFAGPGTQASSGVVYVNDWGGNAQLELTGGVTWNNAGTVFEQGRVVLGTTTGDSATIDNQAGGVIDLTSDDGQLLSNGSGTYGLTNAGLLEKTGGGGISHVQAVLNETSTGTIGVTSGTIAFDAGGTVSGLANGGGAIVFDGASETVTATGMIASNRLYVTAGTLVMQGGTIATPNLSFGSGVEAIGFGDISGLVNSGLIDASDGLLAVNGSLTGGGGFQIETGATLELGGATAQNVTFNGPGATLALDDPSGFTGRLLNLGVGDGLDLVDTVVTSAAIANGSIVAHLSTGGSLVFGAPNTNVGAELVSQSDGNGGTQLLIIPSNVTAQPEIVTPLGSNNSIALPDAHVVTGTPNDQVTLSIVNTATAPADGLDAGIAIANGSAYGTGTVTSLAPGGTNSTGVAIGLNNTSAGAKSGAVTPSFATDGSVSGIAGAIIPQGEFDEISIASVVNTSFQNLANGSQFNAIVGSTSGNQGTGIPFLVANTPNNYWSGAGGTSSITIPVGVNTSTVYTLADNIDGAVGNDEYSITFTPATGSPVTEQYLGGVNTKDYNANSGTDGNATTPYASNWFIDQAGGQHLQTVAWSLPNGFGTLASVTITQVNSQDGAVFAGLTVVQPGGTSFPDAPINLSGDVYRYAAPSVTAPANVILHVGDDGGTVTEALTVANTDPADGFSEGLDASATGAVTGNLLGASGATGDIGAGGSSNALTVSFSTAIAGVVSGTAAVSLTSDGAGVDSLGATPLATDEVPLTATIDNYATAAITKVSGSAQLTGSGDQYTLNLGEVYVNGGSAAVSLGIKNSAASLADLLEGDFSVESGDTQIALAGTAFAGLSAGQTANALSATLDTAQAGTFESQITLLPTGYNGGGYSGALSAETITVVGTVGNLAVGQVETAGPIDFGNARQNSTVTPRAISVANLASAPADDLDATASATGSATVSGAVSGMAPGNTDTTSILAGLNTGTVGAVSGAIAVDFLSDGGSGQTPLTSEDSSVSVLGTVYREASATIGTIAPLVLHTGQTANLSIAVTNNAVADLYSENLIANTTSVTGGIVSVVGGTGDIAAAANGTLQARVSAAASGLLSGAVTLDLLSDGTGIDGLGTVDLGPRTVAVTGTIYNYATVGVSVANTGTLTGSGTSYALHLGTVVQGAAAGTAVLGLKNIATGLADGLSGTVTVSGGTSSFVDSGFGAIGTLSAGQSSNQIDIALRSGTVGVFTETATFTPVSGDSAGATNLAPITITVTGTVVAQQGVTYNLTTGVDIINGNTAANTVVATAGALSAGDNINAGSGSSNILTLQGAGIFDLSQPATLTGISTVWAKEGQPSAIVNGVTYASTLQTVTLRAAENNVAVNVQAATPNPNNPAATAITINGAANNDVINLGYGNDTVTPGVGETVNGGSGNATVMVTSATIGDAINGGSGTTKLWFTNGGSFALGANLTNLTSVYLAAASTAWNVTATTTSGLTIQDADTANNDHLTANGAIQVLTGGGAGKLTMQGAFDTTFQDSAALFNGDTLGFAAGDLVDITGLTYAASGAGQTTFSFTENSQHTGGSLTVSTGGVQKTAITLTGGIFNQGSFTAGSDNAGGTLIRYHS